MRHKAHVAHRTRGRIRMRIAALKGDPTLCDHFRQLYAALPGVESVDVRVETGSVVLKYDPDLHHQFEHGLSEHLVAAPAAETSGAGSSHEARPGDEIDDVAHRIQAEAEYLAAHSHSAKVLVDFFKNLDHGIKDSTGNTIDLKIVLAATLTALTVVEIGATAATPMWVTLGIFGLNHFAELHHQNHQNHQNHRQPPQPGQSAHPAQAVPGAAPVSAP